MKLVGDIGGTKTLLALADDAGELHQVTRFEAADFPDFPAVVAAYLVQTNSAIEGGCLAVAGPIHDDGRSAHLTNRDWQIDAAALEAQFKLPALKLVNDFAGAAMGILAQTQAKPVLMQSGTPLTDGLRLVIGAGTGLGVASLVKFDGKWRVLPGEGGHIGFAPQDEQQDELCRWLQQRHSRVIIEHVVSGTGLASIHTFLHQETLKPADVAAHAKHGQPQALASFDLFASIYGAVAGDYALARMARGGVFLAGGIAAANIELMQRGSFLEAFNAKGGHSGLAAQMPICIVTEPLLGLYGASQLA